jgi:hypothetical protein
VISNGATLMQIQTGQTVPIKGLSAKLFRPETGATRIGLRVLSSNVYTFWCIYNYSCARANLFSDNLVSKICRNYSFNLHRTVRKDFSKGLAHHFSGFLHQRKKEKIGKKDFHISLLRRITETVRGIFCNISLRNLNSF